MNMKQTLKDGLMKALSIFLFHLGMGILVWSANADIEIFDDCMEQANRTLGYEKV